MITAYTVTNLDGTTSTEYHGTPDDPKPSTATLGDIFIEAGTGCQFRYGEDGWYRHGKDDDSEFTLPVATASKLGGIKVGSNLHVTAAGVLSAPAASTTSLGTVKQAGYVATVESTPTKYQFNALVNALSAAGLIAAEPSKTHTIAMSGVDSSSFEYTVSFEIKNEDTTSYTTLAELIAALHEAGHTQHSGTCPATGTCDGQALGYVAEDNETQILLQNSTTSAIGMVTSDSEISTITDTVS